jgi:CO dehydrogenase nickel-insertion accessory protein CooC1
MNKLLYYNTFCSDKQKGNSMTIIVAGGSGADGKTTVLELVAKYLGAEGKRPLAIDANPDQTLFSFFGVDRETASAHPRICDHFDMLKSHLEGQNPDYPDLKKVVDTSPVTGHSRRWSLNDAQEDILKQFALEQDGVRLMQTGTYEASDLGGGCLHTKIAPLIFMLQRLYDGKKGEQGVVLVDNAHGRDAFGTSLYAQGDAVLVVARPDMKSAEILRDYLTMAKAVEKSIGFPVPVIVVGNRLSADPQEFAEEEKFLKDIAGESYIGGLREDPALKRKFSNTGPSLDRLSPHNYRMIAQITHAFEAAERIPERRKAWMDLCHGKATWQDVLTAPGISSQKSDYVPDAENDDYKRLRCSIPGHQHGPGCKH